MECAQTSHVTMAGTEVAGLRGGWLPQEVHDPDGCCAASGMQVLVTCGSDDGFALRDVGFSWPTPQDGGTFTVALLLPSL